MQPRSSVHQAAQERVFGEGEEERESLQMQLHTTQEVCAWPHPLKWFLNQISLKEPGNSFHPLSPWCPSLISVNELESEGWKRLACVPLLVLSLRQDSEKRRQWFFFIFKYVACETNITTCPIGYIQDIKYMCGCVATDIIIVLAKCQHPV